MDNSLSDITVRDARRPDLEALGEFGACLMAMHHNWDPERFIRTDTGTPKKYADWLGRQLGAAGALVLVAETATGVVGYTYSTLEGYDYMSLRGPAGVLQDIFVDPVARKNGVGRKLYEVTANKLVAAGAHQIVLSTAYRNRVARRFFSSVGFRPTMVEMTKTI